MELFTYFVDELRTESLMLRPFKEAEYEVISSLVNDKDAAVQFVRYA